MGFSINTSFFFIVIICITFSCKRRDALMNKEKPIEAKVMVMDYVAKAKNNSIPEKTRLSDANNAFYWSSKLKDNIEKREIQSEIGLIYYSLKDYYQFKKINEEILALSRQIFDSLGMAKSYSNLGSFYNRKKIKDSAFYNFDKAEKIFSQMSKKDPESHGAALYNMAILQRDFKDYLGSEANTIKAIKKFEESKINLNLYLCYNNLGIISKDLGKYDEAIKNYQNALDYARKMENGEYRQIQALNNIGVVYKSQKKYDKAIAKYIEALGYEKLLNSNLITKANLLDNLAYARFLSGAKIDVLKQLKEPLHIRDSIGDKRGLITNNLHLAEYYKSIKEDSIATNYAITAKNIAELGGYKKELLDAFLLLSKVSDSYTGLLYAQNYIRLNDSLIKEERLFEDKFARIKFETEEIVEKNQQISKENEILIIAILGLTALFLLGYIIFRQQQSNKELLFSQTQQESNEEIYRLLLNQQIKLEEGRQMEQQRMSEELHDGVLGRLFGVRLSLDGINQRANDGFTEARNKYIDELKAIEKEIRLISHDLGAETLPSDVAYIDAVENLIGDLCNAHKISFEFNNDEDIDWESVDDQKKVNLFRILQESMQNIFKHASADLIKINFEYADGNINLTILDDGVGFNSTKVKRGIGLKNITSRVNQMQGQVQFINDVDTGGTMVSVSVPAKNNVAELY